MHELSTPRRNAALRAHLARFAQDLFSCFGWQQQIEVFVLAVALHRHPSHVAPFVSRFGAHADLSRQFVEPHRGRFEFLQRRPGQFFRRKQHVVDPECLQIIGSDNLATIDDRSALSGILRRGRRQNHGECCGGLPSWRCRRRRRRCSRFGWQAKRSERTSTSTECHCDQKIRESHRCRRWWWW